VDTRLKRLDEGVVDAIVIAAAGVDRLDQGGRIDQRLDPEVVAPAPGQGAIAIQARRSDAELLAVLSEVDDADVRFAVEVEREVLKATGGTCRAPVGAVVSASAAEFSLLVAGVNSDGSSKRVEHVSGRREDAMRLAREAGERLVAAVALR
jgi:hydroxymethylbilane synthase